MHSHIKHHRLQTVKDYSQSTRYAAGHHIKGVGNNSKMRKFRNVCIEWIGTCILVQVAVTFGLIWFFNNMVTITTGGSSRNVNRCAKHLDEPTGNLNPPISPYYSASGGGETILRKLSSDYHVPSNIFEGQQQQIQEPKQQQDDNDLLTSTSLDPNTGIFDKWRLYKTHSFVSVATNLSLLNQERNVCLAAQTSLDRLYSLTETLQQWSGPVSIALFTPDIEYHVANIYIEYLKKCFPAVRKQVSFHYTYPEAHPIQSEIPDEMKNNIISTIIESSEGCEMTPKQFADKLLQHTTNEKSYKKWRTSLEHPQNLLRNVAKSGCQTKYIMLPDIDMIPNKDLDLKLENFLEIGQPSHCNNNSAVSKSTKKTTKSSSDKCAFVVPVYEISREVEQLPKDKNELLGLLRKKLSRPFHSALFSINQKASLLKQWEAFQRNNSNAKNHRNPSTNEVNVAYKVEKYQFKYEPLYVARSDTPIFDERFIGFGMTRNTQVYEMYVANYSFYVLDNAFSSHWGFQTLKDRPEWRAKQQTINNHRFDDFAKEISARYGRDPYDMLTKLKTLNYKNIKVAYGKADSLIDKENMGS